MTQLLRVAFLLLLLVTATAAATSPRIAIIIDDFGYSQAKDRAVIALPYAITCSVIPGAPHSAAMAKAIAASGKEVLLHIPMATIDHRRLDPDGLHADITQAQLDRIMQKAIHKIPQAVGMNNHMGSLLTSERQPMIWLMKTLKANKLFFIDSRTTSHTVAEKVARQMGVPTRGRNIFLDDKRNLAGINQQFNRLLEIARQRGSAIAIGHPYKVTAHYLAKVLPLLDETDINLVPVSALVANH